jgi:hypothetical protein
MNMNVRNYHARLCEKFVQKFAPEDFAALWQVAEENYKSGKPLYTLGFVFSQFCATKQGNSVLE